MHEFLKKNSTFVKVSIKNNKYGSDSIEEYTERRKKCIGKAAYHYVVENWKPVEVVIQVCMD